MTHSKDYALSKGGSADFLPMSEDRGFYRHALMVKLFKVIDNRTNKEADIEKIALEEEWAKRLVYCDMDGFYIGQDGSLILADKCGNHVFCDAERFRAVGID